MVASRRNLRVADNAPLILSLHRELDALRENANSGLKIGTTKRGIGPAYEDKVGRRAIRVCDLAEPDTLPEKIERLPAHHNALRRGLNLGEPSWGMRDRQRAGNRRPAFGKLERAKGIEPSYTAWEAVVLPLNYARNRLLVLVSPSTRPPAKETGRYLPNSAGVSLQRPARRFLCAVGRR